MVQPPLTGHRRVEVGNVLTRDRLAFPRSAEPEGKGEVVRSLSKGRRLLFAGTAVASVFVVAGIAFAAIPGPGGVIQGCYNRGGTLKVVISSPCPNGYTALSWNQQGATGATGASGAAGATGATGATGPQGVPGTTFVRVAGPFTLAHMAIPNVATLFVNCLEQAYTIYITTVLSGLDAPTTSAWIDDSIAGMRYTRIRPPDVDTIVYQGTGTRHVVVRASNSISSGTWDIFLTDIYVADNATTLSCLASIQHTS